MRKAEEILEILKIFNDKDPNPRCELDYTNAYTLLVAVLLSAQTTDKGVNKATAELFKIADTPQKMLELGLENLKGYIKTIGLYNNKAKNVIALSQELINKYQGEVPSDRHALENLPGVGRKTANVILSVIFGKAAMAVDTHVFRVANRIGLTDNSPNPLATEKTLVANIPESLIGKAHHWLILHGRYVCTARKPKCHECGVRPYCKYYSTNAE